MTVLFLCIQIFFARIADVSLGATRTVLIVKGRVAYAALIGFCEIFIWFIIAREAINTEISSIWVPVSYAAGYAIGTLIGGFLSHKFISGNYGVQIVLSGKQTEETLTKIRDHGFAVSVMETRGKEGDHTMLFIEIDKHKFGKLQKLVRKIDPKAFIVVNETKLVQNGFVK